MSCPSVPGPQPREPVGKFTGRGSRRRPSGTRGLSEPPAPLSPTLGGYSPGTPIRNLAAGSSGPASLCSYPRVPAASSSSPRTLRRRRRPQAVTSGWGGFGRRGSGSRRSGCSRGLSPRAVLSQRPHSVPVSFLTAGRGRDHAHRLPPSSPRAPRPGAGAHPGASAGGTGSVSCG